MNMKKIIRNIIVSVPKNKNKIIFESNSDFNDNSRALYEKIKYNQKYKFIWYVEHPENFKNTKNTKFININNKKSIKYIYHILTSKYIFFTHRSFPLQNYKKQKVVNLTHGVGIKYTLGKLSKDFNYLLAGGTGFIDIACTQYCCNKDDVEMLEMGYPRNDLLFEENENVNKLVSGFDKLILWLPTFRKHKNGAIDVESNENQTFPLFKDEEINELNQYLNEINYLLIMKIHPAQDISGMNMEKLSNIRVLKNEDLDDMDIKFYNLIGAADTVLTDYSSVGNDYLLLNRPIGYVIDDVKEYKNNRGFAMNNYQDYLPGEKIYNKEDFYQYIENFKSNIDNFEEERFRVRDFYWKYHDNKNCERIIEYFNLEER